jgi:hypothetical protein
MTGTKSIIQKIGYILCKNIKEEMERVISFIAEPINQIRIIKIIPVDIPQIVYL